MKKLVLLLFVFVIQTNLHAWRYFPEGTKWTEIRLDGGSLIIGEGGLVRLRHDGQYRTQIGAKVTLNHGKIENHRLQPII